MKSGAMNLARALPGVICSAIMRYAKTAKCALLWIVLAGVCPFACGSEIHEAAKAGSVDVVKAMIEADPARVNEISNGGMTPLHLAAVYGQTEMAAFLLKQGANLEMQMDGGLTPLLCSVMKEHAETVKFLVEKGADVKAATRGGLTSLHIAVQKGNKAILKALLAAGADVSAKTRDGMTPLDWATERNAKETVEVLTGALKQHQGKTGSAVVGTTDTNAATGFSGGPTPQAAATAGTDTVAAVPSSLPGGNAEKPVENPTVKKIEPPTELVQGVIRFGDGAVYEGGLLKGKMHGSGVLTFPDGERYCGQWIDGEKHGEGKAILPNGEEYNGQWSHNKKHGQGTYSFPDGEKYEGQWVADRMNGPGVYTFADGTKLEGQWEDNWFAVKARELTAGKQ